MVIASKDDKKEEIVYEITDLMFHLLVVMGYHNIAPEDIYNELEKRFNKPHKGQNNKRVMGQGSKGASKNNLLSKPTKGIPAGFGRNDRLNDL